MMSAGSARALLLAFSDCLRFSRQPEIVGDVVDAAVAAVSMAAVAERREPRRDGEKAAAQADGAGG